MTEHPLTSTVSVADKLNKIAVRAFGRETADHAPDDRYWCLSAPDNGYADKFSGPWVRYSARDWACGLCVPDPYLSDYEDTYLLKGNGSMALIEAMRTMGWYVSLKTTHDRNVAMFATANEMKMTDWHGSNSAQMAIVDAAYAALTGERP